MPNSRTFSLVVCGSVFACASDTVVQVPTQAVAGDSARGNAGDSDAPVQPDLTACDSNTDCDGGTYCDLGTHTCISEPALLRSCVVDGADICVDCAAGIDFSTVTPGGSGSVDVSLRNIANSNTPLRLASLSVVGPTAQFFGVTTHRMDGVLPWTMACRFGKW